MMRGIGLPQEFAETGFHMNVRRAKLANFQVVGERSSGTNYVRTLLEAHTPLKSVDYLVWKHGFPQAPAIAPDTIVVVCVRNAIDWARSMYTKPWHSTQAMQELEFSEFLRAEWQTRVDREGYFPRVAQLGTLGQPLQHDRNPLTGFPFRNIFDLRRAKLRGHLSYLNRGCSVAVVAMETAVVAPDAFVSAFRIGMRLQILKEEVQGIKRRLGNRFEAVVPDRAPAPITFSDADFDFALSQLDLALEAQLGYDYG